MINRTTLSVIYIKKYFSTETSEKGKRQLEYNASLVVKRRRMNMKFQKKDDTKKSMGTL